MKYRIEKLTESGWRAINGGKGGRIFDSPDGAAKRLLSRLQDRYGEDRVRLSAFE